MGNVERRGRVNVESYCWSAVAAFGYVLSVFNNAETATIPAVIEDAQQYFVRKTIFPYAEKLENADDRMVQLSYKSRLITEIVETFAVGVTDGKIAVLG